MGLVLEGDLSESVNAPGVHGPSGGASNIPGAPNNSPKNLNMISAFTHVGGDTLRTLSVFVAAAIATFSGTPGYLCDAWASCSSKFYNSVNGYSAVHRNQ